MQFSKLRLSGFKSFVDPTELVIKDGLTGVVGPNGCGKSNLLEALRWVMGENRPTAMRGGGMEDVIFAGAATRPARNFAEVSLHLDNSERLAPNSFNDDDSLEIVRRITREAGSAYKSNGKDVRARDVQMLVAMCGHSELNGIEMVYLLSCMFAREVQQLRILVHGIHNDALSTLHVRSRCADASVDAYLVNATDEYSTGAYLVMHRWQCLCCFPG